MTSTALTVFVSTLACIEQYFKNIKILSLRLTKMDNLETLKAYPDLIQIIRGIYILSNLQTPAFTALGSYLINKVRTEDRLSFYQELISSVPSKADLNHLPLLSNEEVAAWESSTREQADNKEFKISQAKNAGLRDSYRAHILDLSTFYFNTGDMNNSMKALQRAKEISITAEQQFDLFSLMALTSLFKKNISFAQNNAQKIILLTGLSDKQTLTARVIMGLCNMENSNYKLATEFFLGLNGENNKELALNSDLAVYIVLGCLASMDRKDIKADVVQSKSFLVFSEDEPRLSELLDSFVNCKFSRVVQILDNIRREYVLDYFIGKSILGICEEIKNRCMVQFLKAFKRIKISDLAINFEMSEKTVEEKLAKLITDGKVDARIDAHQKIVKAREIDQKQKMHKSVLNTAIDFIDTANLILLKTSMIQEDILVRPLR